MTWTTDIFMDGRKGDMTSAKTYDEFGDDGTFTEIIGEGESDQITQKGSCGVQDNRLTTVIEDRGKNYSTVYTMHIDEDGSRLTLIDAIGRHIWKRVFWSAISTEAVCL